MGQSLPERENARERYLRIQELFAGKNPAAWCSKLLCSARANLGQLRPWTDSSPIYRRSVPHAPVKCNPSPELHTLSRWVRSLFSCLFTTLTPPCCVTGTHRTRFVATRVFTATLQIWFGKCLWNIEVDRIETLEGLVERSGRWKVLMKFV